MTSYAELHMGHHLLQVYVEGIPEYTYSGVTRRTARTRLESEGWIIAPGSDWKLIPPNSFRLALAERFDEPTLRG